MISVSFVNRMAHWAWDAWLEELSPTWAGKRMPEFERSRYAYGHLPADIADPLRQALESATAGQITLSGHLRGATPSIYRETDLAALNAGNRWLLMGAPQAAAIEAVLDYLREPVAGILGCPWRVLNVRSWATLGRPTEAIGPYAWHTDGLPKELLKIMVYSTPCGSETGGLAVDIGNDNVSHIQGPAGTWVLLYNSRLRHCGIPPTVGERLATEITLAPWTDFDLRPVSLGLNGAIPIFPLSVSQTNA